MVHQSYWKVLTRRKTITVDSETKLNRVMRTFDLTALGVGATLGVGVYVLAGHVARDQAGPSVVLSFAIAALASLFAGLCYAEFGARVPKAGSAYIYSYVCIGEFAAFVVGWNLILEYIIGSASVSKGLSLYLDSLINNTLKTTFHEVAPIEWEFMGNYFDFFAFSAAFTLGIALAFGLQKSTLVNNCFTVLNVGIVIFVIIAGSIKADITNWQIQPPPANTSDDQGIGYGGFFPFGFEGTLKGAATCFFGFVGFDCIATTGEEVRNPQKAIPRAILFSLLIIFLAYFGVSTVLTLMWPFNMQDVNAPLPYVFHEIGWPVAQWIVTIGGMFGLVASLFGAMFPLPRIIYAMSQDGLVFRFLGDISPKFKTPIAGTLCAAALTGTMAALFDLTQLVNMLSIGTLLAYTVVAVSITILRFMDNNSPNNSVISEADEDTILMRNQSKITCSSFLLQIFNCKRRKLPTTLSTRVVGILLFFYCLSCFGLTLCLMYTRPELGNLEPWALALTLSFLVLVLLLVLAIAVQPREIPSKTFTVPMVPLIPAISIFINIYLMLQLDIYTWIRFGIWMALGSVIYLACICLYSATEVRNESLINSVRSLKSNGNISYLGSPELERRPSEARNSNVEKVLAMNLVTENEYDNKKIGNGFIEKDESSEELEKTTNPSPNQSFDEIVLASELNETVKEMKNSNGKTIFIEDTTSQSLDTDATTDDAISVIAMLDDVLEVEESNHPLDFYRKTSIDSEQIPSFTEQSTIAMVHKSCDSLREEDNEGSESEEKINEPQKEVLKVENITRKTEEDPVMLSFNAAIRLVSDVLSEPQVEEIINNYEHKSEPINTIVQSPILSKNSSRKSSSFEPLDHPENYQFGSVIDKKFRDHLSRLIIIPPPLTSTIKKRDEPKTAQDNELERTSPISPKIRSSKSETDIRNLMIAQEIGKKNSEQSENNTPIAPKTQGENSIPQAPKFDPVLYKTMGTKRHTGSKERPKLNIVVDSGQTKQVSPIIPSAKIEVDNHVTHRTIPFKEKLEAILRRGPSYRGAPNIITNPSPISYQKSKDPDKPENVTNGFIKNNNPTLPVFLRSNNNNNNLIKNQKLLQSLNGQSKTNLNTLPTTISEARKSLRPVPPPIE